MKVCAGIVFGLVLAGAAWGQQKAPRVVTSAPAVMAEMGEVEDYPTFGVKFAVPAGWRRQLPAGVDTIGTWVKVNEAGVAEASMTIQHMRTRHDTPEQVMTGWLKRMSLASARSMKVDGEMGIWARGSQGDLASLQVLDVAHGETRYWAVLGRRKGGKAGEDDAVMKGLMESWKFREVEEPSEHLELAKKPVPMPLAELLWMNLPACARLDEKASSEQRFSFTVANVMKHAPEFRVNVGVQEGEPATPANISQGMKGKFAEGEALTFKDAGQGLYVSGWAKLKGNDEPLWMAVGIVPVTAKKTAVATFFLERGEAGVQEKYLAAATKMMLSIEPNRKAAVAEGRNGIEERGMMNDER